VNYWLHPQAAEEHTKQVAYYEAVQAGLGRRYHVDFLGVITRACIAPNSFKVLIAPDIRCAMFKVFHFDIVYREVDGRVQVLAIAHHRRQPGYWTSRL
jgi:toxin ParE1/3/4